MSEKTTLVEQTSPASSLANKTVTLEYYKAPFGRRLFAFLFDFILMMVVALGFFAATRLILENSERYKSAFNTYVDISVESGLYVYHETEDNLVTITEYYQGESYEDQNSKEEAALTAFYTMPRFFNQADPNDGLTLYNAQKIGDSALGVSDGLTYFVYAQDGSIAPNPEYDAKTMHNFYVTAVDNGIQYLNNVDDYVAASKTLSKYVNFIIIPCSISLSFIIFEFLVPLLFFRRGYQTFGFRIFHLSLITGEAISPHFKTFLARFLWMFLVEVLGSMVTFLVPAIVSFSMFAFRKDGQAFHDYMAGTYVVDSEDQSIYLSKAERDRLLKKAEETEARTDLLFDADHKDIKKS
jgi:uncharacterized RDD family membrane protein YckC